MLCRAATVVATAAAELLVIPLDDYRRHIQVRPRHTPEQGQRGERSDFELWDHQAFRMDTKFTIKLAFGPSILWLTHWVPRPADDQRHLAKVGKKKTIAWMLPEASSLLNCTFSSSWV